MAEEDWANVLRDFNADRSTGRWTDRTRDVAALAERFNIATSLRLVPHPRYEYTLTGRAAEVAANNAADRLRTQPAKFAKPALPRSAAPAAAPSLAAPAPGSAPDPPPTWGFPAASPVPFASVADSC